MMTQKNFENLAKCLGQAQDLNEAIQRITLYCAFENPRFDEAKFHAAIATQRANRVGA